ncbi:hypothetical protein [Vibrio sagamiensis]|uniref:Uncharacterized protein n=2 Tax=Vibrio sagamiensis TaxID=512650 RepID=A0A511QFN8_9VIBR|nr:hypothetical protein [Vibrio sagamiensis]GEM76120.1 hypothetical protein VSA01S_22320 [Vibrio sagamiensis NBRC 104589]
MTERTTMIKIIIFEGIMKSNFPISKTNHLIQQYEGANTSFNIRSVFNKKIKPPFTAINLAVKKVHNQYIINKAIKMTLVEAEKPTKKESNIQYETLYNHVIFRATSEVNSHLVQKADEIVKKVDKTQAKDRISKARNNIEEELKSFMKVDNLMNSGPLYAFLTSQMEGSMKSLNKNERDAMRKSAYEQLDQHIDKIIKNKKLNTHSIQEVKQHVNLLVSKEFAETKRTFNKLLRRNQDFPIKSQKIS